MEQPAQLILDLRDASLDAMALSDARVLSPSALAFEAMKHHHRAMDHVVRNQDPRGLLGVYEAGSDKMRGYLRQTLRLYGDEDENLVSVTGQLQRNGKNGGAGTKGMDDIAYPAVIGNFMQIWEDVNVILGLTAETAASSPMGKLLSEAAERVLDDILAAREAYDTFCKEGFVTPQVASVPDASIEEELKAIIDVLKGGGMCGCRRKCSDASRRPRIFTRQCLSCGDPTGSISLRQPSGRVTRGGTNLRARCYFGPCSATAPIFTG